MNRPKYLKCGCQHCGGHIEFPVETIGSFVPCPHCGQETELMLPRPPEEPTFSRKALILTASAIILMVAALVTTMLGLRHYQKLLAQRKANVVVPVAQPPPPTNPPIATPRPEEGTVESDFRVSPIALEKQTGSSLVYAVGTVKNLLDKQRFGVKLELELDDAAGQKIGLARDYQQILEPGGEWKFKALVVESKASSARLASIHEQPEN